MADAGNKTFADLCICYQVPCFLSSCACFRLGNILNDTIEQVSAVVAGLPYKWAARYRLFPSARLIQISFCTLPFCCVLRPEGLAK